MSRIYQHNLSEIAAQEFEDGPVMINFLTGRYFTLNRSGHRLWAELQEGADEARLASALADLGQMSRLEAERLRQDVRLFLDRLINERLVAEVIGKTRTAATSTKPLDEAYEPPRLDVFDDLAELILLDPIHDINEKMGWPVIKMTSADE
jgi:Coenzyme PQQ synthesis protein D (PqqD)